eukprot:m.222578 g.222578  ORF g.222578 m.222578 type:complete len:607 (+) comp39977_c0_seq38:1223-3043(+)
MLDASTLNASLKKVETKTESTSSTDEIFPWDVITRFCAYVGGIMALISFVEDLYLNRGLACSVPRWTTREQTRYVELFCTRYVSLIDSMPTLLVCQSLSLIGPHVLWKLYATPMLAEFFSLIPLLARLRNHSTSEYDTKTTQIVKYFQEKYQGTKRLSSTYGYKLGFQLFVGVAFLLGLLFAYRPGSANFFQELEDFKCSGFTLVFNQNRSISCSVDCTYTITRILLPLWIIDLVVLIAAICSSSYGLYWLNTSHWNELDYKSQAMFLYRMSMNPGSEKLYNPTEPGHKKKATIRNDLDFLVIMLFSQNKGQGKAFFDVQTDVQLEDWWSEDYDEYASYLYSLLTPRKDRKEKIIRTEIKKVNRRIAEVTGEQTSFDNLGLWLQWHCCKERQEELNNSYTTSSLYQNALYLFCGSRGTTIKVLRFCERMTAIDFNHYFIPGTSEGKKSGRGTDRSAQRLSEEEGSVLQEIMYETLRYIRVSDKVTSSQGKDLAQFSKCLIQTKLSQPPEIIYKTFDLVVINCLEPHFRASIARVTLDKIMTKCIEKRCLFLLVTTEERSEKIYESLRAIFNQCVSAAKDNVKIKIICAGAEQNICIRTGRYDVKQT